VSVIKLFRRIDGARHKLAGVAEVDVDLEEPVLVAWDGAFYVRNSHGQYIRETYVVATGVLPESPPPAWTGVMRKHVVVCNCDLGDEDPKLRVWEVTVTERPVEVPNSGGDSNTERDSNVRYELERRIVSGLRGRRCGWIAVQIDAVWKSSGDPYVQMVVTVQDPGAERRRSEFTMDITECDLRFLVDTIGGLKWGVSDITIGLQSKVRWFRDMPKGIEQLSPSAVLGPWMEAKR